jgi:tRNA threonylcarbamoyladenosine biosynthesis protein TsaB
LSAVGEDAPLVLAIESATSRPSVALLRGDAVLALRHAPPGAAAAEVLLPGVQSVLEEAQVSLGDVGLFALAIGPGSFTGLRVGLASVKGLVFGRARPVAAVSTLEALCLEAGSSGGPVAALLDARRGDVYAAAFGPGGEGGCERELLPEGLYALEALVPRLPQGCRFTGDGVPLHAAALGSAGFPTAREVVEGAVAPAVGRIGRRLLALGRVHDAAALVPRYLRRAEAEARRTGEALEGEKPF